MDLYRTELKFLITTEEYYKLKGQLAVALKPDPHNKEEEGGYLVKSLYFDDLYDSRVQEKADGIEYHQKFRLRNYGEESTRLELKTKVGNLTGKEGLWVDKELEKALIESDFAVIYKYVDNPLIGQLIGRMKLDDMRLSLGIDYIREAYVFPQGEVRITFDKEITAYRYHSDLQIRRNILEPQTMILEVKYTEILPEFIRKLIFYKKLQAVANSKYYLSWLLLMF